MNRSITFGRLLSRILFILLLLGLVSYPRLHSPNPGPVFSQLRDLLMAISLPIWMLIIAALLVILWVVTRGLKLVHVGTTEQDPKEKLSIGDAVKPANGGTGLASVSYAPTLPYLGLCGWLEVKDPDKECIVIDGKHELKRTRLFFAPMVLFGKPIYARRILLSPPPLENIKATALTNDQLELTLEVSVKYSISNPVYVASLSAPLSELNNLITGVIVEHIHAHTLEDIVKDEGSLRSMLEKKISESSSIRNNFKIAEVLKALPTGDERILEIIRQTKAAIQKHALIEQEGENRTLEAGYDLNIKKGEALLKEEFDQKLHIREVELLRMQQEYETVREVMRAIAQVVASGVNPAPAIREIRSLLNQPKSHPTSLLTQVASETPDLIQSEQKSLKSIQPKMGIKSFDIQPSAEKTNQPGCVVVEFEDYLIKLECNPDYPNTAPQVFRCTPSGDVSAVTIPWYTGSTLVDAITSVVMQERPSKAGKNK